MPPQPKHQINGLAYRLHPGASPAARAAVVSIGNDAGDLDSLVSAIAYAEWQQACVPMTDVVFVPAAPFARRDFRLRTDASLLFEHCGIALDAAGAPAALALLEAAASALPIVATDVPGCRDLVVDGVNGFLVDVAHPSGIAAALLKLSRDRDFCNKAGAESRQLIMRKQMDIRSISRKYAHLLKDISQH